MMLPMSGTGTSVDALLGFGGQVLSFGKTLSVATQFARFAAAVFVTVRSTSFVPSSPCGWHTFVTVRPGVLHSKVA